MMYKDRKGKYVSVGIQRQPSMPFEVSPSVHLPDSEAGASWYDPSQKPYYAESVPPQKREPLTMPLNTALIFLCALFVLFGVMTLSRTVRKAALSKDISAMEQSIQKAQTENADLAVQVAEARDMARIGYDASHRLNMIAAAKAETIAVHAPDTRPLENNDHAAAASAKTNSW